jgi:hypothetical protein
MRISMDKEARESQVQLSEEAKELQIRIAQLQSCINAFTSMSVGFFATMLGFIVAGYLLFTGGYITGDVLKIMVGLGMFGFAMLAGIRALHDLNKVKLNRKELHNLTWFLPSIGLCPIHKQHSWTRLFWIRHLNILFVLSSEMAYG